MHTRYMAWVLLLAAWTGVVGAQDYPSRPIAVVVPSGPGGGTDILGRHFALRLGELWKTGVVVENRAGAGSLTGTDYVAKARPDGHTLLVGGIFNMVMNQALIKNLSYDAMRDFVPIGYTSAYPFLLLARNDLPVSDLRGLVAYAKE
ncbi:MAG: Bug family tripartite tricarboxylate transporter substrate binding protein, partial [Burkholderiales bacterium]